MENTTNKMSVAQQIIQSVSKNHLLKHSFYQTWSDGKLSKRALQQYSKQYFHHVDAFPRYISATHSNCESIQARQELLRNLTDEEQGERNHPELWLRFAEGLGVDRNDVKTVELNPETQQLIDTFFALSRSSYAEGLGALFAYEQQVPEVAQTKIEGLKKFYGIDDERSLDFFETHVEADVYHTDSAARMLEELSPEDQEKAKNAAMKASLALWKFLDGVQNEVGDCTA